MSVNVPRSDARNVKYSFTKKLASFLAKVRIKLPKQQTDVSLISTASANFSHMPSTYARKIPKVGVKPSFLFRRNFYKLVGPPILNIKQIARAISLTKTRPKFNRNTLRAAELQIQISESMIRIRKRVICLNRATQVETLTMIRHPVKRNVLWPFFIRKHTTGHSVNSTNYFSAFNPLTMLSRNTLPGERGQK